MESLKKILTVAVALVTVGIGCGGSCSTVKPLSFFDAHNVQGGIVVFVRDAGTNGVGRLQFVDLNDSALEEKSLTASEGRLPVISADGTLVAFEAASEAGGVVMVCRLEAGAEARAVTRGYAPHWWTDPQSGLQHLTYASANPDKGFPAEGKTFLLQIDTDALKPVGDVREFDFDDQPASLPAALRGGLSHSGRYMATGWPDAVLYDFKNKEAFETGGKLEKTRSSISPSADPAREGRLLFLNADNKSLTVQGPDFLRTYRLGVYIQEPRWATQENFMACILGHEFGGDVMVFRFDDSRILGRVKVATGNCRDPYLWIRN